MKGSRSAKEKSKLDFKKASQAEAQFFQFKADEDQIVGHLVRIIPEDEKLEGIEIEKINESSLESEGIFIIPSHYQLVKFFEEKEPSKTVVYQIIRKAMKELDNGRKVMQFDIYEAELPEAEEEEGK